MPYADPERQREYSREWIARRRAAWFEGRYCLLCGTNKDLVLHHIDPTVKVSHRIWSWSQGRRNAELAKCTTLCDPCHHACHLPTVRAVVGKITRETAIIIRERYQSGGITLRELGEIYRLTESTVGRIARGDTWR